MNKEVEFIKPDETLETREEKRIKVLEQNVKKLYTSMIIMGIDLLLMAIAIVMLVLK